jgi:hypothetical protein
MMLLNQLKSAIELSSLLQVQHTAAQNTISALKSKVISLETLVKSQAAAATLTPLTEPKPPSSKSLTQILFNWKESVKGQWSSVQEEWASKHEHLVFMWEGWDLVHPGTRKMVCTSLCEILTFNKNLQTNMFILIVGQLRYPEVLSTTLLVWPCLLSYHLGSYWVYCGMPPHVPGTLSDVLWYATTGTWDPIGCTVVCHTMYLGPYWVYHGMPPHVPGTLSDVPWYIIPCTWDLTGCTMVYHHHRYLGSYGVHHGITHHVP